MKTLETLYEDLCKAAQLGNNLCVYETNKELEDRITKAVKKVWRTVEPHEPFSCVQCIDYTTKSGIIYYGTWCEKVKFKLDNATWSDLEAGAVVPVTNRRSDTLLIRKIDIGDRVLGEV